MSNDNNLNFNSGYIHEGDLVLNDSLLEELPPDLTVKGNLDLSFSKVTKLNPGLMVFGDLILSHSLLKTLPAQIYVEGDLVLKDSLIEILPEYLTVYGQIDLSASKVCKLSHHLTVSSLDLAGTKIKRLPQFLTVDIPPAEICERKCFTNSERLGVLALQNSQVTHLPDYAKIHSVNLQGSQVVSYGKNLEIEYITLGEHKLEGIPEDSRFNSALISHDGVNLKEAAELRPTRDIQIENCLAILPENLELDCSLEFYRSSNSDLPENLIINGYLTINDTQIRRIPQSLKIMDGSFILEGARTCCEFPEKFVVRDLELYSTSIQRLPDELYIAGYLILQDSLIAKLPHKLETGINLIIRDNKAPLSIPDQASIVVGHSLYWAYAPFETWPKNMLVCGSIFLAHSSNPCSQIL